MLSSFNPNGSTKPLRGKTKLVLCGKNYFKLQNKIIKCSNIISSTDHESKGPLKYSICDPSFSMYLKLDHRDNSKNTTVLTLCNQRLRNIYLILNLCCIPESFKNTYIYLDPQKVACCLLYHLLLGKKNPDFLPGVTFPHPLFYEKWLASL